MAIITTRGNTRLLARLGALIKQQRLVHALSEGGFRAQIHPKMVPESSPEQGSMDMSKWKKVDSRVFGIKPNMISQPSWIVLKILQAEGFEAYLVGGCVRDLILRRMPKDFDVITTANLKEIKKKFHRAQIIGQRFPICRVHVRGTFIEVSSFETVANTTGKKEAKVYYKPPGCDKKDFERWKNSMHRDFTINSLFFDPFANKIYDYVNGIADLRSLKLRTLGSAKLSFEEDCARILRGLRIAARLSLSISKETESAMHRLSSSISNISQARLLMELNYMFSYGASEPSLCLLWRFDLLKILLPFHAAYFDEQTERKETPLSSTMLMKVFSNLDKVVTCDRPSDCNLWVGLLALHLALVNNPQDALVVLTLASVLYHEAWEEGVKFSRDNAEAIVNYFPEISCSSEFKSEYDLARAVTQLASLVLDSIVSLTATGSNIESVSRYPVRPGSGSVFVTKKMAEDVAEIFGVLVNSIKSYNHGRKRFEIDYQLLGKSYLREVRFVLGKVILETMGCSILQGKEIVQEDCLLNESMEENSSKGRKRGLTPDAPEMKQGLAKKRKLVTKKGILPEQDIAIDKQDVLETRKSPQRELISVLGNMVEKQKCQLPEEKVIEQTRLKKIEKHQHNTPQDKATKQKIKNRSLSEETIELKGTLEKKEYPATQEVIAEKTTEDRQQLTDGKKGNRPQDKATKQKVKKHNTSEHEVIKLKSSLQKNEFPATQEVISEKIREDRQVTDKKKGSLRQLSSLFSDEVIQNHKPAAEKEKCSLPRLSSLFK